MNSSGIKRGLATSAVSALAVAGLPFLASTASATPIASTLGNNAIAFYSQDGVGLSDKNDGSNTTVSLVTGGGANVTSVLYQYSLAAAPATFIDVPGGLVARNADGVFAYDWAGVPETVAAVRAVPNTGEANAVTVVSPNVPDASANTVELNSEGSLGVFQAQYTTEGVTGDYVGVTGTVSQGSAAPTVSDASHGTAGTAVTTLETTTDTASDTFNSRLDIDGYPYSVGAEPNQIAINAATNNTDDAEGSTLYVQTIGSITATPATQDRVDPSQSVITITVLDTTGKPVAGAQVFKNGDTDDDGAGPDTDTDGAAALLGYTDGRGQIVDDTQTTAGSFKYYVNATDNDPYVAAEGDKRTDAVTVTTYTPTLGEVDVFNERSRSNFDLDELGDGDDFTIRTKDQKGAAYNEDLAGADVQYRWVIDPAGPATAVTSPWIDKETDANGKATVDGLTDALYATWSATPGAELPEGSYTIEARRPNVGGTGLMNAAPETFAASESEITYDEGASANAPVNGNYTVHGKLANDAGALAGRAVKLTYTATGDSALAPQAAQPAGVTVTGANTATAITDADGNFAVALRDPAVPANVTPTPETGTLNAIAEESKTDSTSLQGDLGPNDSTVANNPDNAEQDLTVQWAKQADVSSIDVNVDELFGQAAPGQPVDLDIVVHGADGDTNPNNDPALADYPVTVTVDKGFLSPNANTIGALTLAAGHDSTGDLYGFFKNDGASKSISTGDAAEAGAVAAMERDAGFDDDGLVDMVITVTAGGKTVTKTVTFDDREMLNQGASTLERAAGAPQGDVTVGQEVPFQLYVHDQFGNLVGDQIARISDDSTVADFTTDEDFDRTLSDFTTNGPGIVAFSDAPAVQTLMAAMSPGEVLVDANDDPDGNNKNVSVKSDPINWVAAPTPGPVPAGLTLRGGDNGAADDSLLANAIGKTEGATVKLFRKRADGTWKFLQKGVMNSKGNYRFDDVADLNGNKVTRYKAIVKATALTNRGVGKKKVR